MNCGTLLIELRVVRKGRYKPMGTWAGTIPPAHIHEMPAMGRWGASGLSSGVAVWGPLEMLLDAVEKGDAE